MDSNTGKVSFAVRSSKPVSKPNPKSNQIQNDEGRDDHSRKQFVTEFDPDKTLTDSRKPRRIIPPKAPVNDDNRPRKRMHNLELAIAQSRQESEQLDWELENKSAADAEVEASQATYGLNLRSNAAASSVAATTKENDAARPAIELFEKMISKDVKKQLEKLPDDEGLEQFDDMPVEEFSAALLAGFGWYEGRGLGKNSKGNVKIKEFGKKSFVSDDVVIVKKEKKKDHSERKEDDSMKLNGSSRSNQNQIVGGAKQVNRQHLEGQKSDKKVEKRSRETERREDTSSISNHKVGVPWLRSHIRVRIISKELKRGRLYLKKGEVVDVVGPSTCDISMDDGGELIQGVDQDFLETALPKRGGPVLVLYGKHKGVYGDLVARDLDRESGVVRDADTHELLNVKLEQIAEYIGDPSYIGY